MNKVLVFGDSHAVSMFNYLSGTYKSSAVFTNGGVVGESLYSGKPLTRAGSYKGYNLVLVFITTNDLGISIDLTDKLKQLISTISSNNDSVVMLASPGVSSNYQYNALSGNLANGNIRKHNEQMKNACSGYSNVTYVDIYTLLSDQNKPNSQSKYRADTVHLSITGNKTVSNVLPEKARSLIGITVHTPSQGSNTAPWFWPVPNVSVISAGWYYPSGGIHEALDIAANYGTVVVATRSGKVTEASINCDHNSEKNKGEDSCGGGYGNRIYIDHGNGYESRYAHLSTVEVSAGQSVVKGQRIGTVGSTGNSTGPHLHFEIRLNGVRKDPQNFVSYDESGNWDYTSVGSYDPFDEGGGYFNSDYSDYTSSEYDLPEFEDTDTVIVGRRASELTSQPMSAYFQIYVGNNEVILSSDPPRPNTHQFLEVERYTTEGNAENGVIKGQFTIFDDNWDEIEKIFSDNVNSEINNIRIAYGYSVSQKSRMYRLMLTDYSISLNSTGVLLNVQFVSRAAYDNLNSVTIETNTKNPTVAIKEICKEVGWTVIDENFDSSKNIKSSSSPFNIANENPLTYINTYIIPLAQTENGEILRFYVDDQGIAYLKKQVYTSESISNIRTYIYQKGYDSVVKDIEFDIKGVFGGTSNLYVATELNSTVIDPETKEETTVSHNTTSTITEATGLSQHTRADQSSVILDAAGRNAEEASNMLYYYIKNATNTQYTATMTIIGDPNINLFDTVRLINVTDSGYLHHTSGIYTVLGIIDEINNGEFTTTLNLARNGDVNNNGPELINPKLLVK